MSEIYAYEKPRSRLKGDLLVLALTTLAFSLLFLALPQEFLRNNPFEYYYNKNFGDSFDTISSQSGGWPGVPGPYPYARVFIPKGKIIEEGDIFYDNHSIAFRDNCKIAVGRKANEDIGIGKRIRDSYLLKR